MLDLILGVVVGVVVGALMTSEHRLILFPYLAVWLGTLWDICLCCPFVLLRSGWDCAQFSNALYLDINTKMFQFQILKIPPLSPQ